MGVTMRMYARMQILVSLSLILIVPCNGLEGVIVDKIDYRLEHNDYTLISADYANDNPNKARVIKPKFYIHPALWKGIKTFRERRGLPPNVKAHIVHQTKRMIKAANKHLRRLADPKTHPGGFIVEWDSAIYKLDKSDIKIGRTFVDRLDGNKTKPTNPRNIWDLTFAFQQAVAKMKNRYDEQIRILLISLDYFDMPNDLTHAATEEQCLCNPTWFACVGVFGIEYVDKFASSGVLLAHELGHALGAALHDDSDYVTGDQGDILKLIMATETKPNANVWSPQAREAIRIHNTSCLAFEKSSSEKFKKTLLRPNKASDYGAITGYNHDNRKGKYLLVDTVDENM